MEGRKSRGFMPSEVEKEKVVVVVEGLVLLYTYVDHKVNDEQAG
jgi:hypothetical protein